MRTRTHRTTTPSYEHTISPSSSALEAHSSAAAPCRMKWKTAASSSSTCSSPWSTTWMTCLRSLLAKRQSSNPSSLIGTHMPTLSISTLHLLFIGSSSSPLPSRHGLAFFTYTNLFSALACSISISHFRHLIFLTTDPGTQSPPPSPISILVPYTFLDQSSGYDTETFETIRFSFNRPVSLSFFYGVWQHFLPIPFWHSLADSLYYHPFFRLFSCCLFFTMIVLPCSKFSVFRAIKIVRSFLCSYQAFFITRLFACLHACESGTFLLTHNESRIAKQPTRQRHSS